MIVNQQTGFRNNKGASDYLLFFTQKVSEALNLKEKKHAVYFLIYQRPLTRFGTNINGTNIAQIL